MEKVIEFAVVHVEILQNDCNCARSLTIKPGQVENKDELKVIGENTLNNPILGNHDF